ncbi:hypothetical protein [Streptomyces spongiae]|uniref:hypothetical protein n=1 Tax=Streptomyces spongiae TaxID=565072 RepID=UPI001D15525A|nr:hypothetical protein [Streptomyces spongiae]
MAGRRPVVGVAVGEPKKGSGTSTGPSPSSSASAVADEPYTLAEEQAPKTRGEAVAFVRGLDVRPDYFATGYRKRNPFESDPAQWAVLGEDCLWRREALPETALASLTRAFEMPEQGGKEAVYVSLTVTVHENIVAARRDMAGALESALRCPEQRLNATDVVRGLYSRVDASTDLRNAVTEDDLVEAGEWVVDGENEAHPFDWYKFRVGPVTVAATARHGAGRSKEEDTAVSSDLAKGVGFVAAEIDNWGAAGSEGAADDSGGTDGATDEPAETKGAEQ